jgi:hypothetical protein
VESDDGIKVSLFRMRDGVAAVACGVADEDGSHRVKLDFRKLGLPRDSSLVDLELWHSNRSERAREERVKRGEPETIDPTSTLQKLGRGEVAFDLRRHDFRVILAQPPEN